MSQFLPLFPADSLIHPGYSQHKKPTFASIVQTPPSGRESTGRQQVLPFWEYNLTFEILRDQSQNQTPFAPTLGFTELQTLSTFWLRCNAQYGAFIYSDLDDNSRSLQVIGTGDGTTSAFIMVRTWGSGSYSFTEPVGIVDVRIGATLNIFLNGSPLSQIGNWWIDDDLRTLRFSNAPANGVVITATFSFFYFCRFLEDELDLSEFYTGRWELKTLKFRSTRPDPPASGNPYTILNQNTTLTTPQSNSLHYIEATIIETGNSSFGGGGRSACLGLAGIGFNRANPWQLDVNIGSIPSLIDGFFFQMVVGTNSVGWGYVQRVPAGLPLAFLGDVIGMAWDDASSQVWWQNATQNPGHWYGNGSPFTPDPVAKTYGFTYGTGGQAEITGPAYILVGAGRSGASPAPEMSMNFTGPFVAAPTGYLAAGGTIDPATVIGTELILSSGNTYMTAGSIAGSNQPTSFALGTIGFAH